MKVPKYYVVDRDSVKMSKKEAIRVYYDSWKTDSTMSK